MRPSTNSNGAPHHAPMRGGPPLPINHRREREHDGNTCHEYEHRKDEIVETKSFPIDVLQLGADEASGRRKRAGLVGSHYLQCPSQGIAAENPKDREAPQRIERGETACCRSRCGGEAFYSDGTCLGPATEALAVVPRRRAQVVF